MKKNTLLILLLLTFSLGFGQTTLSAGDVAITGINSNNNPADEFSFVLLTDISNGTEINFTDCGVTAAGAFRGLNTGTGNIDEGIVTWTATSDLSCGTEVIIAETAAGSNVYTATTGTATETNGPFALAGNGDQLIAFQGTTISPSFLFALHFANGLGWAADATDTQTSTVPSGLTDGINAIAIPLDSNNIIYNYNILGDSSAILAALVDPSEWSGSGPRLALGLPGTLAFDCDNAVSTTTLTAGEVAITGANSDNPDEFSFVLLTDISNGTKINFTDGGWTAAGAFRGLNPANGAITEGVVTWTADSDLSCGTEIIITDTGGNTWSASSGTATETITNFALGNGDQIIAFQGSTLSPNFLFALHFANGLGWAADATDNTTSTVPSGLTDGVNAIAIPLDTDNIAYSYNTLGDSSAILAALVDPFEWVGSGPRLALGLPIGLAFDCDTANSTTDLTAGEVAITGANATNPDEFSFVLLTDVSNRTKINFSDGGWTAAGAFRNLNTSTGAIAEGVVTWEADSDLPCGTEIIITDTGSDTWSATLGTASETITNFALGNGDQIIAFQGTTLNPNFIFALHFANGLGWATDAVDNTTSTVPAGLTNGVNAIAIPLDANNIIYNYTILGDSSAILEALVNPAKWIDSSPRLVLGLPGGLVFDCDTSIITTTLTQGDIAITGANADNPDEFSFVLLTDISNGTQINFTDKSWDSNGTFILDGSGNPTLEGIVTWIADNDFSCGTEIIIAETFAGSNIYTATLGTASETEPGFALNNNSGDQVIAFQGSVSSPQFIYAFHFGNNNGWTDATNQSNSAVPAGLTNGINAVAYNFDNSKYNYSDLTGQSEILAALVDNTNWGGSNGLRQTLGLPIGVFFTCTTPGTCGGGTVTWSGGTWFGGGGVPDITTNVVIATDYSTTGAGATNFSSCTLTINAGVTLTVENDTFIIVENDVTIDGNLIVESSGSFIQNGVGASAGTFTGNATLNKTTPFKNEWYYYTYWGSPMTSETIGNVFPLVASDRRFSFNAANFVDTDGDDVDDDGNDWEIAAGVDTMIPGVGYAVTAAKSGFTPGVDNISFTGAFNTGDISIDITYDPANLGMRWNFIGNPYPSAIDFVAFHLANSAVVEGVVYLWSQGTPPDVNNPGNQKLNFSNNDYAIFNVGTGGTGAREGEVDEGSAPNGYIASAQGFFIPAKTTLTNPIGHQITFTNAMRVADNTSNNQFFKGSSTKKSVASNDALENKLWVNLTSDNGVFNQILVGYVDQATDDYDGMSYDAPKLLNPGYAAALYSHIENDDTKYAIQGKALNSINENESIKLGLSTTIEVPTLYKFSIDHLEGDFLSSNAVYLKDNLLSITHNLTDSDYTFTSEVGAFNDRFEIVFQADALSTDKNNLENNTLQIVQLDNDHVLFKTSESLTIKTVTIFDLLGRPLYDLKGTSSSESYRLSNLSHAAYIVKVQLSNGAVLTKKMIKN